MDTNSYRSVFENNGKLMYTIECSNVIHYGYLIPWNVLSMECSKWSRNRDSDQERVFEMMEEIENGGYVPRMIHVAVLNDEGLVCYDGNHRREVFDRCLDQDIECIVDVMFNVTQDDIYRAFHNINRAVQLPALYLDNEHSNVKNEILKLVREYEVKYKDYVSPSCRCHAPNFNRDVFTDNIFEIYTQFGGIVTVDELASMLKVLNVEYSKGNICRSHDVYKPSIITKCQKHGLWLFLERTIPFEHMQRIRALF